MFRGEAARGEGQEYKVEEPETPIERGGFRIPRGGDEELLEMLESWTGRRPETVALEYNGATIYSNRFWRDTSRTYRTADKV